MKLRFVSANVLVARVAGACVLFAMLLLGGGCTFSASPDRVSPSKNSTQVAPLSGAAQTIKPLTMPPSSPSASMAQPTPVSAPPNLKVRVDEKLSVSAVITSTGGLLALTTMDGTKFTLSFPNGALLEDVKVTLSPIVAVDGLPFSGGLVGGVQMSPEGLRMVKPVTLTIESARMVAAKGFETVAFAYHQNGEGMYLHPSDAKGNVLTLELWHFSGAGAAQGTPAEIQQQQRNIPSNAEDAFMQRMREYLGQQRGSQLLGGNPDPEFAKRMGTFFREYYDRFVAPQLRTATSDCAAAPAILSRALSWSRSVQIMGYAQDFRTEIEYVMNTLSDALVNCYNKEYDQCVVDKDKKHRTPMLSYYRQAVLLGIADRLDASKIEKCPQLSYRASGPVGNGTWSGLVCSLEKPFTINANVPDLIMPYKFVPANAQAGSVSVLASEPGILWSGGGIYSVQGTDPERLKIVGQVSQIVQTPAGSVAYSGALDIDLTAVNISCE